MASAVYLLLLVTAVLVVARAFARIGRTAEREAEAARRACEPPDGGPA